MVVWCIEFAVSWSELKSTQMALDEYTCMLARQRALVEGVNLPTIEHVGFSGVGSSEQGDLSPVSERHDEALGGALALDHNLGNME